MDAQPPHTSTHLAPSTAGSRQHRSRGRRKVAHKMKRGVQEPMTVTTRPKVARTCHPPTKTKRLKRLKRTDIRPLSDGSQMVKVLPNHIISHVLFGYLNQSPKQLSTIRSVCTLFRSMSRTSFTLLDLSPNLTRMTNLDLTNSLAQSLVSQFTNLREVDFSFCDNFDDRQLELLAPMNHELRVLKLRGTKVSDAGVMSYFQYNKCLKWCEAQKTVMGDANSIQITAANKYEIDPRPSLPLEVLDLSETKILLKNKITNKSLLAVAYTCSELKHLSLSMCSGITDDFLDSVPLFLTKLTFLDISMSSITAYGCCHLARMPTLREVNISACPALSGKSIRALVTGKPPSPTACDVDVTGIDNEQYTMEMLGLTRGRGSVSQLKYIAARFAKGVDANLLDIVATQAPHLQSLDLRHYRGNDLKTGLLSPLKMSLRKLRQKGVEVSISM
ncbi:hypothetical protein ACHAXR_003539 [Thalassiosira sp. AJA248-18]